MCGAFFFFFFFFFPNETTYRIWLIQVGTLGSAGLPDIAKMQSGCRQTRDSGHKEGSPCTLLGHVYVQDLCIDACMSLGHTSISNMFGNIPVFSLIPTSYSCQF